MEKVLDDYTECCGCNACVQICPAKAITLLPDKYGFLYPEVNTTLCVDCGKCRGVCPSLHREAVTVSPIVLSAYANDEEKRNSGSSGGIFGLLAENVISHGGYVYGAAFDDNLKLRHIEVSELHQLPKILKSKYLQSSIGNAYLSVRRRLKDGKTVLFCGTPCQCQALNNFIDAGMKTNLILVDFICHGVPSQEMFDLSIRSWENRHHKKVKAFKFRHKEVTDKTEAGLHHWQLCTRDDVVYEGRYVSFPYYYTYLQYMSFRPSCYKCKYAVVDRCTDMTLGDFWGLDKIEGLNMLDFNHGYSMLIVNGNKGKELLNGLDISTKQYSLDVAVKHNFAYTNPTVQKDISKEFFRDYEKFSWEDLEKKYMIVKTDLFHRGIRFIKRNLKKLLKKC